MGNIERAKLPNSDPADRLKRIERAATIIGSHIAFARDYQGLGTTAPTWQNVGQTVEGLDIAKAVERLEISDLAKGLEVSADPMLKKVFHNLLEDSVKYAGKSVCARIDCRMAEQSLTISYQDSGPGVPLKEKERIFEKGRGHGTGLGLFLSKEVLAITGISIKETGTPGEGARFEMLIPRASSGSRWTPTRRSPRSAVLRNQRRPHPSPTSCWTTAGRDRGTVDHRP